MCDLAARYFNPIWPFWDIMHQRVKWCCSICSLKGTLMQIWKSTNIFVFIWKYYVEECETFGVLFLDKRKHIGRFLNLHWYTFKTNISQFRGSSDWFTFQISCSRFPIDLFTKLVFEIWIFTESVLIKL